MEVQKVQGMKCNCGFTFAQVKSNNDAQIVLLEADAFDMVPKADWIDYNELDEYFKNKDGIVDADERSKNVDLMKELVELMDARYHDPFTKKLAIYMKSKHRRSKIF